MRDTFTTEWNAAPHSQDAFAETADVLLLNYPGELHPAERTALLPAHAFLGSAVRAQAPDEQVEAWLAENDVPVVYVSLGSFLSVRGDVLATVAEALTALPVRVALASGSTPPDELGPLPPTWLVRAELPQVRLLQRSALAISHGGNNSVTEALTAGVPLVLLPLSTDQFAGAAALEAVGFGQALDPNRCCAGEVRDGATRLLDPDRAARTRLDTLTRQLPETPGAERAFTAVADGRGPPQPPEAATVARCPTRRSRTG